MRLRANDVLEFLVLHVISDGSAAQASATNLVQYDLARPGLTPWARAARQPLTLR